MPSEMTERFSTRRLLVQSVFGLTALCPWTTVCAWTGGSSSARNNHAWTKQCSPLSSSSPPTSFPRQANRLTMYFDDVSRHAIRWEPSLNKNVSPIPPKEEDKDTRVQRLLSGYNAELASHLSECEIQEQTKLWTEKSGVVGNYFGDELYTDLLGVLVARGSSTRNHKNDNPQNPNHRTQSLVHSLAYFWQSVAAVIELHTDKEVCPPRWTPQPRYANRNMTAVTAYSSFKENVTDYDMYTSLGDRVHMIVLPDCPDLYEYQTFTTLLAAVEFSKELCLHLGRHFTLTAFHPHFKNSPKLFSPERHSPFPTIGMQLKPLWDMGKDADLPMGGSVAAARKIPREQSKKDDSGKILPHPDAQHEDDEIGVLADARIRNLDATRAHFEVLFNSAAAMDDKEQGTMSLAAASSSRTLPATVVKNPSQSGNVSEEEQLAMTFRQERQRRRGNLPPEMVHQLIALWMDGQRYVANNGEREMNPALEFMDTIDGYTVCTQKMGELVYAEAWQAIRVVYEKGMQADIEAAVSAEHAKSFQSGKTTTSSQNNHKRFSFSRWMHSFSASEKQEEQPNKEHFPEEENPITVVSSLFIATKFNTYNAQAFKRFAITVNAVLKRITDGRMFLEVFHPEYVGNKGYNHDLRRSPFPMIQICYLVQTENEVVSAKKNKEA